MNKDNLAEFAILNDMNVSDKTLQHLILVDCQTLGDKLGIRSWQEDLEIAESWSELSDDQIDEVLYVISKAAK